MKSKKLERFLRVSGWTEEKLAEAARLFMPENSDPRSPTQATINRIKNGERTASLAIALAIERATSGQVRAEDLNLSDEVKDLLKMVRRGVIPPGELVDGSAAS